jgi:HEAT repeat protein
MKHITFAQTLPAGSILADEETPSDRPIRASGMYNLGDDIEFEDVLPTPARKKAPPKRVNLKLPKTQLAKTAKAEKKPGITLGLPSKIPRMPQILEKLRSANWEDQNEAITELMLDADHFVDQIRSNLRDLCAFLLEYAGSLRSALAKNALSCFEKWIGIRELDFEAVSEMCASSLLTLVSSQKSKAFLSGLSGDCFRNLMDRISLDKAVDILVNEHRRKHEDQRIQIAMAMSSVVLRMTDHSALLRPLIALVKDKNPNVREAARTAISGIRARSRNFGQLLSSNLNEEERTVLMKALAK